MQVNVEDASKSGSRRCFCRGCREDILGPETTAYIAQVVADAPPLTPEKAERLRRIFAPAAARIREQQAAGTYVPMVCPRPNCECGRSAKTADDEC